MDQLNILQLFRALLKDMAVDRKTCSYVLGRLHFEGVHFITHVLPSFSKHVLLCLEQGYWSDFSTSVKCVRGLPVIFRVNLLRLFVYDSVSSRYVVREDACPVDLLQIRQICEYVYKLAIPFSPSQLETAAENFAQIDSDVPVQGDYDTNFVDAMRKSFETYYPRSSKVTVDQVALEARPGPGTFSGSGRDFWMRNYQRPSIRHTLSNLGFGLRYNKRAPLPRRFDKDPDYSEVLFVPKDSRGPRTIMREPYDKLLFQMGYYTCLRNSLEADTHHRVNFRDQTRNRDLAWEGSKTKRWSTLDLKDASDRVSYAVAHHIFRYVPIGRILNTIRTPKAKMPNGVLIGIRKLAGMGSGLTFPTMALIIHLAICTHISKKYHIAYIPVASQVYVYGDDVVLPTAWFSDAIAALERVGLRTNSSKCYTYGNFRESCGGDYFRGNDVTPVRLKLSSAGVSYDSGCISSSKRPEFLLGLERHARELVKAQCFGAASFIYSSIEKFTGPLPLVSENAAALGRLADRSVVLDSLKYDSYGRARTVQAYVPLPLNEDVNRPCPYQHLRQVTKVGGSTEWEEKIFPAGKSLAFGVASVPRKYRIFRRNVSGLSLT